MRRISTRICSRRRASRLDRGSSSSRTCGRDDEASRQGDALLLPAGEAGGGAARQLGEPDEAEGLHHAPVQLRGADLADAEAVGDVLVDVQVGKEAVGLEDRGRLALVGRQKGHVVAADEDAAARRQLEAGDHAQRGGLAAARGPEQGHELAAGDLDVGVPDGRHVVAGLGVPEYLGDLLEGHRHRLVLHDRAPLTRRSRSSRVARSS